MLYLLHAKLPVGGAGSNGAQHYLGWTPSRSSLALRLWLHRSGRGARLTQAFVRLPDQELLLANVWEGGRTEERLLKNRHHLGLLCPVCNPHAPTGSVSTPLPPPHSRAYKRRSPRHARETGGASRAIRQMQAATLCPPEPHRGSGTS